MKKYFFLYTLLIFCNQNLHAQYIDSVIRYLDFYDNEVNKRSINCYYISVARKTTDRVWHVKDYYASTGTLQMEGIYLDSKLDTPDGLFFYYYHNGQVETECTYNRGNLVGLYRQYNKSGRLTDSLRYKSSGMLYHKCYRWDDSGRLCYYGDFDSKGSGAGYETGYYPDGTINYFGKFSNGQMMDSTWTFFHKNGVPSFVENYDSGKLLNYSCYTDVGIRQDSCDTSAVYPETGYNISYYLNDKFRNTELKDLFRKYKYPVEFNMYLEIILKDDGHVDIDFIEPVPDEVGSLLKSIFHSLPAIKPARLKNRPVTISDSMIFPLKIYSYHQLGRRGNYIMK